jgi:Neuraminidase (sialidase)
MKTNHKQNYSYASTFMPLLRYVTTRNLAVAMFIAVALLGTTRGNETGMTKSVHAQAGELSRGALEVYSATDEFNDGDTLYYAHSAYMIYTLEGKVFKNVENHISRSDEIPEVVALPAGSYMIEARSERDGYVRVPVVIKAGQLTIVDLDLADGRHTDGGSRPVIVWRVQAIRNFSILPRLA